MFYLIKILKEICYTILNLDLSICFISVSARIDFNENRIPEMLKKELKRFINKTLNLHLEIHGNSVF